MALPSYLETCLDPLTGSEATFVKAVPLALQVDSTVMPCPSVHVNMSFALAQHPVAVMLVDVLQGTFSNSAAWLPKLQPYSQRLRHLNVQHARSVSCYKQCPFAKYSWQLQMSARVQCHKPTEAVLHGSHRCCASTLCPQQ